MLRLVPILAAAVLAAAILWASGEASIVDSFAAVAADPWGLVALIDLYAGFAIMLVVIGLLEPDRRVTLAAVVLTPVLGNLVPAAWLLARLPMLTAMGRDPRGSGAPPAA